MDSLERTFRHLVRTIQANHPAYLTRPFDVAELYQNILPYRHHRRDLGFETNQDYEMALTELLSGARGYLVVDDGMRERLSKELASPNPDPTAFREFSTTQVALSPDSVRQLSATPDEAGRIGARRPASTPPVAVRPPAPPAAAPMLPPLAASPARAGTPVSSPSRQPAGIVMGAGESCRYCGGVLPAGRRLVFCPHCGQNLTVVNCLACGTELEVGWKFCTTCGRPVTPP